MKRFLALLLLPLVAMAGGVLNPGGPASGTYVAEPSGVMTGGTLAGASTYTGTLSGTGAFTAGAGTFTTVNATGGLTASGNSGNPLVLTNSSNDVYCSVAGGGQTFGFGTFTTGAFAGAISNQPFNLRTNNTNRWQIDSSGNLTAQDAYNLSTGGGSITIGGGSAITKVATATATLDFGSTAAGTTSELYIALSAAAVGDQIGLGIPATTGTIPNTNCFAYVFTTGTAAVKFVNDNLVTAVDPPSGSYRVTVFQY